MNYLSSVSQFKYFFLAESTKCRLSTDQVVDLTKKAVGDDGSIGPEEDKIINNIFRKGKDISRNEKIKGIIERFQFKIKKKIESILLDMEK